MAARRCAGASCAPVTFTLDLTSDMAPQRTHYNTLKVAADAPFEVVRAAYRVLAQKYHPDRNPGDPAAAAEMARVNEGYRILSDAALRMRYDEWLKIQPLQSAPAEAHATSPVSRHSATPASAPQNPHTGHSGKISEDLEQLWESWFGRSGARRGASEPPHEQPAGAKGVQGESIDLNTVSDGVAALFRRRRRK